MDTTYTDKFSIRRERRKWERLVCSRFACSCAVRPVASAGQTNGERKRGAVLLDICANGICFESNFAPRGGTQFYFEIRPIEGPDVVAKIRILHARPSETNGLHIIGSEFDELDEGERQNLLTVLHTISRMEEGLANR